MQEKTPLPRLVRLPEVLRMVGFCRTKWLEMVKAGTAPNPVKLGYRTIVWREDELVAWLDKLPRVH